MHKWSSSNKVISLQKTLHLLFYVTYQHEYFIFRETAFSPLYFSFHMVFQPSRLHFFLPTLLFRSVAITYFPCLVLAAIMDRAFSAFHSLLCCVLKSGNAHHCRLNFHTGNTKSFFRVVCQPAYLLNQKVCVG